MARIRILIALSIILLVAFCGCGRIDLPAEVRQIRIAALNYQIKQHDKDHQGIICLEQQSAQLSNRNRLDPLIMPALKSRSQLFPISECDPRIDGVRVKGTDKLGIIISVGAIEWVTNRFVKVRMGSYTGGLGAEGDLLYLVKIGNRWVVIRKQAEWFS